jgi:hypothetical protein
MANTKQVYSMETERVLAFIKSKLGHNSCRKADRPKLEECKEDLKAYGFLNLTQTVFIKDLMMEQRKRSARYKRRHTEKKREKLAEQGKQQRQYLEEIVDNFGDESKPQRSFKKFLEEQAQFEETQTENEVAATKEEPVINVDNMVTGFTPAQSEAYNKVSFNELLRSTPQINKYLQTNDSVKEEAKQDADELPGGDEVFKPVPVIDFTKISGEELIAEFMKDEDPHTVEMNKTLLKRVNRLMEIAPKEINAYLLNVNQISLISSGEPHILYLKGLTEHELAIAFMRDTGGLCDAKWKRLITEFYNGANGF